MFYLKQNLFLKINRNLFSVLNFVNFKNAFNILILYILVHNVQIRYETAIFYFRVYSPALRTFKKETSMRYAHENTTVNSMKSIITCSIRKIN